MANLGAATDATYTDGRTARRHIVRATVEAEGLRLTSDDGAIAETWPFADLRLVDEVYAGRPVRLKRKSGDERLTVADSGFLDELLPHARRLRRNDLRRRNIPVRAAGWIGATAAILAGFWFLLPLASGPVASLVSLSWEEGLGRTVQRQAIALIAPGVPCLRQLVGEGQQALDRTGAAPRPPPNPPATVFASPWWIERRSTPSPRRAVTLSYSAA